MYLDVYDESGRLCNVEFVDNLTREGEPDYVNMNCRIGITRYPGLRYTGWFVIMYYDTMYPDRSYTELISEEEAYDYLQDHGREDLIDEFHITLHEREREVH